MKIDNFLNKVGTEVDIINKQHEKMLSSSCKSPAATVQYSKQKVEKLIVNQVKVLEDSMKYLNEESHKVRKEIK